MNTMYDVQSILSFALQAFTIASLVYFSLMFVFQYPVYAKKKTDANSKPGQLAFPGLQAPAELVASDSTTEPPNSDRASEVDPTSQNLLSQNPKSDAALQSRKKKPTQTGVKKQKTEMKEKRFTDLGETKVQVYQLRGKDVIHVDDFPFDVPSNLKLYILRAKSVILLSDAQAITQNSVAAKEVKKAA